MCDECQVKNSLVCLSPAFLLHFSSHLHAEHSPDQSAALSNGISYSKMVSSTYLMPWPGPQVMSSINTRFDPVWMETQSSPAIQVLASRIECVRNLFCAVGDWVARWRTCTDPAVQDEDVTGTSEVNAVSIGAILGCRDKQPTDIHAVAVSESEMELGAVSNPQILYTYIDTILKDQTLYCKFIIDNLQYI